MFLWKKRGRNSKSSFWFFMTMAPVVIIMWIVAVRLALIPDDLFTEALISGGGLAGVITIVITRLYTKRREHDIRLESGDPLEDQSDPLGAGFRESYNVDNDLSPN